MWSWLFGNKTPPPPPPPPKPDPGSDCENLYFVEFDEPWRKMKWDQRKLLEEKLRNFCISHPDVQHIRILLVGPVGAGKSSFINSINNVFQGRITSGALVGTADTSFTKAYETHYFEGEDGKPLPFIVNDIMGLQVDESDINKEDIVKAIRGFVPEGYNFEEGAKNLYKSDPEYRRNPELKDQTFCLVNVLPADNVSLTDQKVVNEMKFVRQQASKLKIPQVIIMTKPDKACPLVKKNIRKIYKSKKIKEKMQECSYLLGVPMNHVFPVKNYHEEMNTNDDIDILILNALDQIVHIASDELKKRINAT